MCRGTCNISLQAPPTGRAIEQQEAAICDPLTIGIASAVGSVASAGVSYVGQESANAAQQKANDDWVAYQRAASQKAAAEDEAARQKSQAAMQTTEQTVNPQSEQNTQTTQAANLTQQFQAGTGADPGQNVKVLAGSGGTGTDPGVSTDMATRVTNAAREAQGRIAALAGLTSYGSGYGDMSDVAQSAITTGNQGIALQGDMRQGIAKTLGVAQQVQPVQFAQGSNIAGSVAGSLASLAGNAFGTAYKQSQATKTG
jgi:hypothetical protein